MIIKRIETLVDSGAVSKEQEIITILQDVKTAVGLVEWPPGSGTFTLYPKKQANGVVPIKKRCMDYLKGHGWELEHRMALGSRLKPGPVDAVKVLADGLCFAVEWETGNISSSHRALNKLALGLLDGILKGGILILPSRDMYYYLTDRIGNYAEIEPYFKIWKSLPINPGFLAVIEVEHDGTSENVPPIKKGTDGRALR